MRSIAFADFLIGVGILFVIEGLLFAASPAWMRRAMKSALATPDNILRAVGIVSAVSGLILIWLVAAKRVAAAVPPESCRINASVTSVLPVYRSVHRSVWPNPVFRRNTSSNACAAPVRAHCGSQIDPFPRRETDMTGADPALSRRLRPWLAAICPGAARAARVSAPAWRAARTASPTSPRR